MKKVKAFTLIELLVVVAIIAVLISMLLPALGSARDSARKVVCGSNMSQVAKAFQFYANENHDWLPTYEASGGAPVSAFGNYVSNYGGVAKLVKRPAKIAANNPYGLQTYYARTGTGYLENADLLFCPSDIVRASFRQKNPTDTHGWTVYELDKQYYSAIDYAASGYWYINVQENEITSDGDTALFAGMKRYKVDDAESSRKFILWDIGHSNLTLTGYSFYLRSHNGWNVLYADGHVVFQLLSSMNHYLESTGNPYNYMREEFNFFDMHS